MDSTSALLGSVVCRRAHFDAPWFSEWETLLQRASAGGPGATPEHVRYHRKIWEWVVIAQALQERGMLAEGRRGCGFAVGREPLASLFANRGVEILGTDLGVAAGNSTAAWDATGQHAASLDALHWPGLIDRADFDARVRFMPQDMRALRPAELGTFDFLWSSCSLEHLGTLEAGIQFVLRSSELLRPGGIAVHTTEFNLSARDNTVSVGDNVLYRGRDIDDLAHRLRLIGCAMERFDDFAGTDAEDIDYDYEPFYTHGRQHLKLMLSGHVSTSCLLIITKGRYPGVLPAMSALKLGADSTAPFQGSAARRAVAALRGSPLWRLAAPLRGPIRALLGRR